MRTKKLVIVLATAILCYGRTNAQAEAVLAPAILEALNSRPVADLIARCIPGSSHTRWVAIYADGTQVYNDFQSRRTAVDVANYFAGYTNGDCDSRDQRGYVFCYRGTGEANGHVYRHGQIVDLQMLDRTDHWKSLLAFAQQYSRR